MDRKSTSRLYGLTAFYIICSFSLFVALYLFTYAIGQTTNLIKDFVVLGSESLLIMSPIWIVGKRWRWTACMAIALICLFLFANGMYFRYWQDLLPFYSIVDSKSYNALVFNSVPDLFRLSDVVYLFVVFVPIAAYKILNIRQLAPTSIKLALITICSSSILFLVSQVLSANAHKNYMHSLDATSYSLEDAFSRKFEVLSTRCANWQGNGLICYTVGQLARIPGYMRVRLTQEEENLIISHLKNSKKQNQFFHGNEDKNLIFIIVESLNANVVNKIVNGRPLTPVLNRLIEEDGAVSCLKVVSQTKDGGSSDGQMIYNTGLLPIKTGSAAMLFGNNAYLSLVTTLKPSSSMEVIAEDGNVWNHRITSAKFGYDTLEENVTTRMVAETGTNCGNDESVFRFALQAAEKLQEPFILEITTLSMHTPYRDSGAEIAAFLDNINDISPTLANYYRMTNYFDTQLGEFLDGLKASGIYDRSVIVIASDHSAPLFGDQDAEEEPIVFVALNTGQTQSINRIAGQIDVFPTVIDIMGGGDWHGVGVSMLNPDNNSAVDATGIMHGQSTPELDRFKTDAWKISDLIIRSDYFGDR